MNKVFTKSKSARLKKIVVLIFALLAIIALYVLIFSSSIFSDSSDQQSTTTTIPAGAVEIEEEVLISGLENPWDIAFLPNETMLFTERNGLISAYINEQKQLIGNVENVEARGEGGLLGITVDSNFEENSYIYLCHNARERGRIDVRVTRYKLNLDILSLEDPQKIVTGIPARSDGTHSGCRIKFTSEEQLWITTGDAKNNRNPQDPKSLSGKILRVDREGKGVPGNATGDFDNRIFSYGHRNPQGIVVFDKPIDNVFGFSAEHGPDVDDEINLLVRGNFGWDPKSGYNQDVPMTDLEKFPNAIEAIWSSGDPTLAISGIDIIRGEKWRELQGALAVAALKAEKIMLFEFNDEYEIVNEREILNSYGRIRSVTQGPDGNLYVTTDNDKDDKIIRLSPKS